MKRGIPRRILTTVLAIILVSGVFVERSGAGWIDSPLKGKKGWYGYEVEKENKEKPEKAEKKPEKVVEAGEPAEKKPVKWPTAEELYRLKPSEIRKYIERASEEAIANPTEENVARWIRYVHVAQVKASEFAGAWAWVMQQNPDLYRTAAFYPSVAAGKQAFWRTVWREIKRVLDEEKDEYAILFFHGLEGYFDEAMERIIGAFLENHPGWRVERIDIRRVPVLAERLNITYTPQLWLLKRGAEKPVPLAAGPVSVTALEKKLYHTILVLEGKKPFQHAPYYPFKRPEIARVGGGGKK